jgi:hypothetical protein
MAEEMLVTSIVGYAEAEEQPAVRVTALLGYAEANHITRMLCTSIMGYAEVKLGATPPASPASGARRSLLGVGR